ncbi:TetR/AcrR family transcriptional regulator [Georgenia satyanarayanai]|uniref:TetR/AcrR family transcriptional regulator n=1 Tax=Georgenia satyanarayanai TaxID=860221 RepID=UPI00203AA628|nr:TetR/AcrR family transcriptional regulator [Georgenia satyanarayanai]MCM3660337.1 TetR/AcrR family transcriptional regulator [Georgenia satyanarayanai]
MPSTPAEDRVDGRDARWAAHRSSRRAELVRAARRAVHHRGPDLSMDDLAAEIGTSKSIVYRYFSDKSGLQGAVGAAVIEDLRGALGEVSERVTRPRDRIAAMVDVYLGIVESSAGVYAFVTQPEATATAGALRGFVAEIEDIVAEALLPVLRHGGGAASEDHALAALWGAGVVGHVRSVAERWIAARGLTPENPADARAEDGAPAVEGGIATLDRAALAAHITDWLWTGAMGVARRSRNASTRTETDDAIGDPS